MWHISVIFVRMITKLYPTPVLWCGVISETLKNAYSTIFKYEKNIFLKKFQENLLKSKMTALTRRVRCARQNNLHPAYLHQKTGNVCAMGSSSAAADAVLLARVPGRRL